MAEQARILIIDDDEAILDACSQALAKQNYFTAVASDGGKGLKMFQSESYDLVVLDLKLPKIDGMEILKTIRDEDRQTPVIIITGHATVESAIEAMKLGAFDYLAKPFGPEELRVVVKKALGARRLALENIYLRRELESEREFELVVGESRAMRDVLDLLEKVSATDTTVLIQGESGTGKELIAGMIHSLSPRNRHPFVVVDCGALVETLFESELFGHEKGSFTGAIATKHGRFEIANGGTIFLDEISNIGLNIQAKLLRVIQECEVSRIGSSKVIKIDVRIVAATNRNLADCVSEGTFREDLFYRLNVVPVTVPPLRERREDIPLLVEHFLRKYNKKAKRGIVSATKPALRALMDYDWPGNVRELENTIERAVVLSKNDMIEPEDLVYHGLISKTALSEASGGRLKTLEEMEKEHVLRVLEESQGNRSQAAQLLGIDRKTLRAKIKKYELDI
jgi:DNA-binding NtrC family response regulator